MTGVYRAVMEFVAARLILSYVESSTWDIQSALSGVLLLLGLCASSREWNSVTQVASRFFTIADC